MKTTSAMDSIATITCHSASIAAVPRTTGLSRTVLSPSSISWPSELVSVPRSTGGSRTGSSAAAAAMKQAPWRKNAGFGPPNPMIAAPSAGPTTRITLPPTWLSDSALTSCDAGTTAGTLASPAGCETALFAATSAASSASCQPVVANGIRTTSRARITSVASISRRRSNRSTSVPLTGESRMVGSSRATKTWLDSSADPVIA